MSRSKEARELIKWAESVGWSLEKSGVHPVLRHTNGTRYTIAGTPSDHRSTLNARADLLRLAGAEDPDAKPAGRYRQGLSRRRQRFDMGRAVEEIEQRENDRVAMLAHIVQLRMRYFERKDQLSRLNPRRDQVKCARLAAEMAWILKEIRRAGRQEPPMQGL